ncbi:hypothetical protein FRC15_003660 [Serendipita sp. 397]|nr:hypothetical protein FRC15_003660 [Serendipita sp. 397]
MQNVDFDVDGNEVISHDPLLIPSLSYFLHEHGSLKPNYWVSIQGTHTERRTRVVVRDGKRVQENYTVTIVDFDFNIDLSQLLELDPIFYTVADSVPAYRGGMRMSAEENGPTNIERRRFVSGDEQDAQEAWLDDSERRGVPPWTIPPSKSHNQEEKNAERTAKPLASSRSFEDWLVDYCRSKRVIKDFKLSKVIYGWNQNALTQSIEELIRSTGYYVSHSHASVHIKFHSSSTCVHVRSPNFVSKIFSSWVLMTLFSLILVFPFLWLWRRYWPGAGGKWSVTGVGFPVKKWELLKGTFPGDTVEAAKARLASMPVKQKEEEKRLKAEPDGVWILQGTHEGDWFRAWELSIRLAARDRQRVKWLSRQTLDHERIDANILAGELDRL